MLLMMMCHGVTQPLNGALVIIVTAWRCNWGAADTIALYRIRRLMIQNSKTAPETTPCRLNLIQTKRDHHQHLQNHPGWFLVRMVPYLPRLSLLPYFPFTPLSLRADEHHYMALHYNKLHKITLHHITLKLHYWLWNVSSRVKWTIFDACLNSSAVLCKCDEQRNVRHNVM